MKEVIVLDTGVLGMAVHPQVDENRECANWLRSALVLGNDVRVPEVCDYELRRKLLHLDSTAQLKRLDGLVDRLTAIPLTRAGMRRAAALWAASRRRGHVTGPDSALDVDVILCAHVQALAEELGKPAVVATTNVRHRGWFVDAREWRACGPF